MIASRWWRIGGVIVEGCDDTVEQAREFREVDRVLLRLHDLLGEPSFPVFSGFTMLLVRVEHFAVDDGLQKCRIERVLNAACPFRADLRRFDQIEIGGEPVERTLDLP